MPLVRPHAPESRPAEPLLSDRASVLAALDSRDPDVRRGAARACRQFSDAVALLAGRLAVEATPSVIETLVLNLVAIGGPAAAAALAPLLRSDDAARRFAAAEAISQLGPEALPVFDALVRDPEPQVRVLAAEIARGLTSSSVVEILEAALATEEDVNVCAALIDVLAEIGSAATAGALRRAAERLAGQPFIDFAVRTALVRLPAGG